MKRFNKKKLYEDEGSMLGLDMSTGGLSSRDFARLGGQKIKTQRIPRGEVPEINLRTIENIKENRLQSLRNYYPSQPQYLSAPKKKPIDKWKVAQQLGTAGLALYSNYQRVYGEQNNDDADQFYRDVSDDDLPPRRVADRLDDGDDGDEQDERVFEEFVEEPELEAKHDDPPVSINHDPLFQDNRKIQADVTDDGSNLSFPFFVGLDDPRSPAMEAPPTEIME
jgi:hypothetical protein